MKERRRLGGKLPFLPVAPEQTDLASRIRMDGLGQLSEASSLTKLYAVATPAYPAPMIIMSTTSLVGRASVVQ